MVNKSLQDWIQLENPTGYNHDIKKLIKKFLMHGCATFSFPCFSRCQQLALVFPKQQEPHRKKEEVIGFSWGATNVKWSLTNKEQGVELGRSQKFEPL